LEELTPDPITIVPFEEFLKLNSAIADLLLTVN
jgi:hypothetical protein